MNEMKPITPETPRDTLLLVWGSEGFSIAEYDSGFARWYAHADGKLAYYGGDDLVIPEPTHWMPLPSPPSSVTAADQT